MGNLFRLIRFSFKKHENNRKLCHVKEHYLLSLKEIQWKLRQSRDQDFLMERGHCRTNTKVKRKKEIQKNRSVEITAKELSKGLTNQSIQEGHQTDALSGPTHPLPKDVT